MPKPKEVLSFVPCHVDPCRDCPSECAFHDRMIELIGKVAKRRKKTPAEVAVSIRQIVTEDENRDERTF